MSRAQLTSTVEQNTGGAVAPFLAGKNKIINGDFGIWQRGTTFTSVASGNYTADRFLFLNDGTGTATVSQVAFDYSSSPASDKLPISGYNGTYFIRNQCTAAGTSTYMQIGTHIEDVKTLAGQTATLSFWAKSDSARTSLIYSEQNFGSGGTSSTYPAVGNAVTTTSWQRFSFTITVPSITGKTIGTSSYFAFNFRLGAISVGANLDIWGVQLEAGSVATPFTTATGTLQGELAAAQRYYWRTSTANNGGTYLYAGSGSASSTTNALIQLVNPTTMRIPSSTPVIEWGNLSLRDTVTNISATAITTDVFTPYETSVSATVSSGLTQFRPYTLFVVNNANGYLGISAEL
jgi:hypothetical protein